MAVSKDGNKWKVSIRLGGRDGDRVRTTGFETRAAALRYERNRVNTWEQNPGILKKDNRRLSDLVEEWQRLHGHTLKDPYRYPLLVNLCKALNDPLARSFTSRHFAHYRKELLASGRKPVTANRHLRVLSALFNELIRLDVWHFENPLSKVRHLKFDQHELTYLDKSQITRLLDECRQGRNSHTHVVAKICLSTGARWSEAETLIRSQVKDGLITFNKTKSGKSRSVPIAPELERLILDSGFPGNGRTRLFDGCKGGFRSAYKRAGLKGSSPGQLTHILRHTFASHFVMQGGYLGTLQKILGHSSITMTMRYAHLAPNYLEDAIRLNPLEDK